MRRVTAPLLVVLLAWSVTLAGVSSWLARAAEREHPPIGRFVDVVGLRLHVRDTGAPAAGAPAAGTPAAGAPPASAAGAPVLLLLHGASTSLLDFESSLVPSLARDFRVVSLDRPGHGYSERGAAWSDPYAQARAAVGALDALGIEEAVWIGHSWAGAVVLAALLEQAPHVRAGVLLAGVTHPWEGGSAWYAELAATPVLGPAFVWQYVETAGRLVLDAAVASVFAPEPVPPDYVSRTGVALSLRPPSYRANAIDLTRLSAHLETQSARYGAIRRPLLSITGTADHVVPPRNHDARLAAALPALRSVALEGAGHALHHTRTARVSALIREFIAAAPHRSVAPPR